MIISAFPYLETFAAVVEAQGFGKAATLLGISQPAISYRISCLESRLETKLFETPRRRVILTSAGRRLHELCSRSLAEFEALSTELRKGLEPLGSLTVACPGAFGRGVVFPALMELDLEGIEVEVLFRPLDQIFDLVESGSADIGIAYDIRVTGNLQFEQIAHEEFCLIIPSGTELPDDAGLERIALEPFVTYEECDYVFGKWFDDVFGRLPDRLRTSMRFSRLEEVLAAVGDGRGYTIAPTHAVAGRAVEPLVEIVRPAGMSRSFNPEYAVTRPGWQSRPEVEALIRGVTERTAGAIISGMDSSSVARNDLRHR